MKDQLLRTAVALGVVFPICVSAGSAFALRDCDPHEMPMTEACMTYSPTALKCPSDNDGVLELTARNKYKYVQLFRFHYENNIVTAYWSGYSPDPDAARSSFIAIKNIDLRTETDPEQKHYVEVLAKAPNGSDALMRDVCLASDEARQKYEATLKANRAELGIK